MLSVQNSVSSSFNSSNISRAFLRISRDDVVTIVGIGALAFIPVADAGPAAFGACMATCLGATLGAFAPACAAACAALLGLPTP